MERTDKPFKAALVLEGGALRSMYTAGVLDVFMEQQVGFSYVIGTSAGSLCGLNYVSMQPGRTIGVNLRYCDDKDYIAVRNMFRHGGIINLGFLFEEPKGRWEAFDEQTYRSSPAKFVVVATSCETGRAVYFENPYGRSMEASLKASSSMPLVSKRVKTEQGYCLDGGVADSIPYKKAMREGYEKVVVVRTRDSAYRKKETSPTVRRMYYAAYHKEKHFLKSAVNRPLAYNRQVEELNKLKAAGKIYVIEPRQPVKVARVERDKEKLRLLYEQGRKDALKMLPEMLNYLGIYRQLW